MRRHALIGAASGWGAGFRQTEGGPGALREFGLARWLDDAGVAARWTTMVEAEISWREAPERRGAAAYDLVLRHATALADSVGEAMAAGDFPVVIGGDHAIAMGTWAGVSRALGRAPLGLVWLDAHLDAHTTRTSPSMNAHGMSAAALLDHGAAAFRGLAGGSLRPEHLCYVGVRSFEPEERALLSGLGVRIIDMAEVEARGIADCLAEAISIATSGTAGFGITIDLDGFDPGDAPGVGLRVADGLRGGPTCAALAALVRHRDLRAVEIVEYIPDFDEGQRTAHLVRDLLIATLTPLGQVVDFGAAGDAAADAQIAAE
jgi:arginase